ncbi:DUF4433 domain-containing protein [Corallococcus sp. AS-1-12]|uniref:type II toxin-antitoxin system toxin DNA ADP-ribosyl transferase DarT n=1 Tax=Corallococcus sp. AS-1-12 TaxID=2874598 RepID=UPI001CBF8626|nr:DUF4433 domain-containing protein [Corallococcus sp. AS-1-12]
MTDIYHFTHITNIEAIIRDGGLMSDSECIRIGRTAVRSGNAEIKQRRLAKAIESGVGMGGVVGDYVPFYFAPRSPMLYKIMRGNVPGVDPDQDPLVYCVACAEDFSPPEFVITDGNAAHDFSSHYGDHAALSTCIDWRLMRDAIWKNTEEDGDRMRRRMAEFLVNRFVSWPRVAGLVTRIPATRDAIRALYSKLKPAHQPPVSVRPDWYY